MSGVYGFYYHYLFFQLFEVILLVLSATKILNIFYQQMLLLFLIRVVPLIWLSKLKIIT